jgi:hypothetical protein
MRQNQLQAALLLWLLAVASGPAAVLYVDVSCATPTPPYTNWFTAATNIQDAVDAAIAGDQILVTNGVYRYGGGSGGRLTVDKPQTTVQSINGPRFTAIDGGGVVRCVLLGNGTVLSGFTLTNGVAAGDAGGGVAFGGLNSDAIVSNCVIAGNSAASGGGAASAVVMGGSAPIGGTLINCAITSNSATAFQPGNPTFGIGGGADNCKLYNCTLIGNSAAYGGGGASASTLSHCILIGNSGAIEGGGGTRWSTLNNCTLTGNYTGQYGYGGGAYYSTLNNCKVTGNLAWNGGGALGGNLNNCTVTGNTGTGNNGSAGGINNCTVNNCIVYYNAAPFWFGTDNYFVASFSHSCTAPLPPSGSGNITDAPRFLETNGWSNLRLQSNSPGITAGDNSTVSGGTDLDGRPRIVDGTVDIGAYEFQPGVSGEFIGWLSDYGLATDGSADFTDTDGDGLNNWEEWQADTDPTRAASCLRLALLPNSPSVSVGFHSSLARLYTLLYSSALNGGAWAPVPGVPETPGTGSILVLSDPAPASPRFYRISARMP